MESIDRRMLLAGMGLAGFAVLARTARGGPLDPPAGPVSPTGRTLQEIHDRIARTDSGIAEPRIPVESLSGSGSAGVVIAQPGSYYLSGNFGGEPGKNGIEIAAGGVTLDLNGFEMTGVAGSLNGILVSGFGTHAGIAVMNGTIRGWGERGLTADVTGPAGIFRWLRLVNNGQGGIKVWRALVADCCATQNHGQSGFTAFDSAVENCIAYENGLGFQGLFGARFGECVSRSCDTGFDAGGGAIVQGCAATSGTVGFFLRDEAKVTGNLASDNTSHGFAVAAAQPGCTIEGNTAAENGGMGFLVPPGTTGNLVIRNTARGNGINFSIEPGNPHGPIVNVAGAGDISSIPGANHPWANFTY